jgi:multiple sugar transport system substrate-binding protein
MIKEKEGIGGLACYYGADGNRQNLFIWLNYLWAAGEDVFDNQKTFVDYARSYSSN